MIKTTEKMTFSKKKLLFHWSLGNFISSAIGTILAVIYIAITDSTWQFSLENDIVEPMLAIPFGWFFTTFIPTTMVFPHSLLTWFSLGMLIWAFKNKQLHPLYYSYAACFTFGIMWPTLFWGVMSI